MAKIASSNCNKVYVTDDNPRNENPEKIRREIIKNVKNNNCFNIGSRSKAIKTAIVNANPNEVILIAGKGHENTQIYKNKTLHISDKQILKKIILKLRKYRHKFKILMKIKTSLIKLLKILMLIVFMVFR